MTRFNLSDWALRHRSLVWFLMIVSVLAGGLSYVNIGREEDPDFSIKTMVIAATLPGADVQETLTQVTDRIEKKLEDGVIDELEYLILKDTAHSSFISEEQLKRLIDKIKSKKGLKNFC